MPRVYLFINENLFRQGALLYKLSERADGWACLHAQTYAHSEANRYEHEAVCGAKRGAHDVRGTSVLRRPERSVDGNTG